MSEKNYHCIGWVEDGYQVWKGNYSKIATFVCNEDADNFVKYRNAMLYKYNTTDTSKYKIE